MNLTPEKLAAHRAHLLQLAAAYDARCNFTITDVTPAGFGPVQPSADSVEINPVRHMSREEMEIRNTINEAKTILKGKLSDGFRANIQQSLERAELKLKAIMAD